MLTACLAASRKKKGIDTIDKAFLKSLKYYPRAKSILSKYKVLQFHPFDPVSKKVVAVVELSRRTTPCLRRLTRPTRTRLLSSLPVVSVLWVLPGMFLAYYSTLYFPTATLEVDTQNFPTKTIVPLIIAWVVIGYIWFWYRSINIWVHWNGAIDTFTHYTENQQRTRIAAYCLIPLMFVGIWPLDLFGCIICYVSKAINNEQGLPRTLPIAETLNTTPTNPNVQHPDPPPPYNGVGAKCARP
ncbi:uncharacterized protein B0T23DRAFT_414189 [Neurospora hispaniola]|uniref:Uncharacterized protein n=1 Tax=Neurospora hispaniola TaxID=588809 RepID=A0AAJ0I3Z6_9PEZI|nr:hypothetical protein B0T23DRAFT_414189 [Neurospora hispaniola]